MSKEELISEIRSIFTNGEYPGDSDIIYDKSGTHTECEEARSAFVGKSWDSLTEDFMIEHRGDYTCFSSEAFRYYIPAFLLFAVTSYDAADDLPFNLVSALTLPTEVDTAIMANNIKIYGMDKKMPEVDFDLILRNQLHYTNQDLHNFFARFGRFTFEQSRVFNHFLVYMNEEHSEDFIFGQPAIAIERYWFQFA